MHFRWSLYPNASVEVRLVPRRRPKDYELAPICFSKQLQGKVREDLYDCLDHVTDGGRTHSFTKSGLVYKMIGARNSLGNQGVHVAVHPEDSDAPQGSSKKPLPPGVRVQAPARNRLLDVEKPDPNPGGSVLATGYLGG